MKQLNVAVIGAGSMGKNHARVYSSMKDVELVAICDVNDESKKIADEFNARHYKNYDDLVKNKKF